MKAHDSESTPITIYDLKILFRRLRGPLKGIALFAAITTFFLLAIRQPNYLATASFKHVHKQAESFFAKDLLKEFSFGADDSQIFSIMHSNQVLRRTVEKLGMHVKQDHFAYNPFTRVKYLLQNLGSELGLKPSDPDAFAFKDVTYAEETPFAFYIRPLSENSFEILSREKTLLAQGELGQPLHLDTGDMTLLAFPRKVKMQKLYPFKIAPWMIAVKDVKKEFQIRTHRLDKNVFDLFFKHPNRHVAASFLNEAMRSFQEYHQKENEEVCLTQLAYLQKRQDELLQQFDAALHEHVHYLKNNAHETGCIGFVNELEHLSEPQNEFNSKLFDVDLELKRYDSQSKEWKEFEPNSSQMVQLQKTSLDLDLERKRFTGTEPNAENVLTLSSVKTLYLQCTEKKDQLEANVKQKLFLRDCLHAPDFEVSSLTSFLSDSVSLNLVQNASAIALKLRDDDNRTAREQERLKEELEMQKSFLYHHLTHMIELEKLQLQQLSERIDSLQGQTVYLLELEKQLLQEKIDELGQKISSLPEKWRRENLLLLKKELGSKIMTAMTQLVETKNLSEKLYQESSKHLDLSIPPLKTNPPHLFVYSLSAALFLCFLFYMQKLCRLLLHGFPVSSYSLKCAGLPVMGTLSPLSENLETLRGLAQFILKGETSSCIGILTGRKIDYSVPLAKLLALSGKRVLLMDFNFDKTSSEGLMQFIQGQAKEIAIDHKENYDQIHPGGISHYAVEMLSHPKIHSLLSQLKERYDVILIHSSAKAANVEGQILLKLVDRLIVTTEEESREELKPYLDWMHAKTLAFVCLEC